MKKNMKILSFVVIGVLVLNGLGAGICLGEEIKQETKHSLPNIQTINNNKFEIEAKYSYIRSYP